MNVTVGAVPGVVPGAIAGAIHLYGIPNCDTVKRARAWLAGQGAEVAFHDFKKEGVPPAGLARWTATAGIETLLNRKGTTWRQLNDGERAAAESVAGAHVLMLAQPSVIKRPVVEWPSGAISVGFTPEAFAAQFAKR